MKKDRLGVEVKEGDVVAVAITVNNRKYGIPYTIHICRKNDVGKLILDGALGWGFLEQHDSKEIQVLTPDTDMRSLFCDFIREFGQRADSWDRVYITAEAAFDLYEDLCQIIGHDVYGDTDDVTFRATRVKEIIAELFKKEVQKDDCAKLREAIKVIDNLNGMKKEAESLLNIIR